MKIGNLYFDEKDFLFVIVLLILLALRYFNLDIIPLFPLDKIFVILLISFIARIFLGKGKETIILITIFLSFIASLTLSLPGLAFFLLLAYIGIAFFFKNY